MKQKNYFCDLENGYYTPQAMILIFSLCTIIMSLNILLFCKQKKINTYKKIYKTKSEVNKIIDCVINDFNYITNLNVDCIHNEVIQNFINRYSEYNIVMEDVSTKINKNFLSSNIYEKQEIQELIFQYGSEIISEYGWINTNLSDKQIIKNIKEDFETEDIFPIENNLPLYNIYFMNEDFLRAILSINKINEVEHKLQKLISEINDKSKQVDVEMICKILELPKEHSLFNYIGTKTSFWKINMNIDKTDVKIILAGIPNRENKITQYKLIEKKLGFLGE